MCIKRHSSYSNTNFPRNKLLIAKSIKFIKKKYFENVVIKIMVIFDFINCFWKNYLILRWGNFTKQNCFDNNFVIIFL